MPAARPQTKFNDLLAKVTGLLFSGKRDDFQLMQIERDVSALMRTEPDEAWQLRGYCAAVKGNGDEVVSCFRKAIAINSETETWLRFAQALVEGGWAERARDALLERFKVSKRDRRFLIEAMPFLGTCGWLSEVEMFRNALGEIDVSTQAYSDIAGVTELIALRGYSAADVQAPIGFVRAFLNDKGVESRKSAGRIVVLEDDTKPSIAYQFFIGADPVKAVDLEFEMYEALAEKNFPAEQDRFIQIALTAESEEESAGHADHA